MSFQVEFFPPDAPPQNFDSSATYEVLHGALKVVVGQTIRVFVQGFWRQVTSTDGHGPEA